MLCEKSIHAGHNHSCELNFGVPAHFKNACDGAQSHLRQVLAEVTKTKTISDISAMVKECETVYNEYAADPKRVDRLPAVFHDFVVDEDRTSFCRDWTLSFTEGSFPEPISISQSWSCRLNDLRRKHNPTFMDGFRTLTALRFSANMIRTTFRCPADRSCLPRVRPEPVEDPPDAEDEIAAEIEVDPGLGGDAGNALIAMATTSRKGWTISYRKAEPEKRSFQSWRVRWSKARARFAHHAIALQPPKARPSIADQTRKQADWKLRRRKRVDVRAIA